ncbi:MAG: hypothetical protein ACI35O_07035 [Bacillaceae bacterium]
MSKNVSIVTLFLIVIMMSLSSYALTKDVGIVIAILLLWIVYPTCFFTQGIICAMTNDSIMIAFGLPLTSFALVAYYTMNNAAYTYTGIYVVLGILGYLLGKGMRKRKLKQSDENLPS